jgi:threonine dehydrogenase-like Zn-dependent dehydrogenase
MDWYFEFLQQGKIDVTPIITHRYAMSDYREAFMTCYAQGKNNAVKVLFDRF